MKNCLVFIILMSAVQLGYTQISYPISSYNPTPATFRQLLLTNQQIEDNDTINEEIVDLVTPIVQDSVLDRKREHHQLFLVGWFIHAFGGYGWRAVDMKKQKYVGTVRGESRSGAEEYTEYDINFNLFFHLRKYLLKTFTAINQQARIHRQDIRSNVMPKKHKPTNYKDLPFVRDTSSLDIQRYGLHCELTPQREFRPMLNYLFYPVLPGINIDKHPNFLSRNPSMGFYGASCLDCNHNCHPEIHPYEWIWWMNLHNGSVKDKTWMLGLLKDGSNRFHHWSHNPKTGKVSIPFAYDIKDKNAKDRFVIIEHLVFSNFIDSNLHKLDLPPVLFDADHKSVDINLTDDNGNTIPLTVSFRNVLIGSGLKYWFSEVNWDEKNHILSGYFNMATSVQDLYTVRLTFTGQ
jgi:hypothetical protein